MKAVFLDFGTVDFDGLDTTALRALTSRLETYDFTTADDTEQRIAGAELVYLNKVQMTREIIERASSLRFIGLVATGVDNVDVSAAGDKGVAVANIRAYCTRSVVEHVFGVLLSLMHSLGPNQSSVRRGDWARARQFCLLDAPIRGLGGKTIGIVGFGELGRAVAAVAKAFGMHVLVSARPGEQPADSDRTAFDELIATSDVISLHCPLTEKTQNLIGADELSSMKPSAVLLNTARGGLVDSSALVNALSNGDIAAAGIDVLSQEPPVDGDPLLDYRGDNLMLTSHIAWASTESRQNAIDELTANVAAYLAGKERNRVI